MAFRTITTEEKEALRVLDRMIGYAIVRGMSRTGKEKEVGYFVKILPEEDRKAIQKLKSTHIKLRNY